MAALLLASSGIYIGGGFLTLLLIILLSLSSSFDRAHPTTFSPAAASYVQEAVSFPGARSAGLPGTVWVESVAARSPVSRTPERIPPRPGSRLHSHLDGSPEPRAA